ncbi:hypothetical protein AVEN_263801-1, partial [Araneus ventricosus]
GRYVSAPEAIWRINEFSLSEKSLVCNHEIGQLRIKVVIMLLQHLIPSKGLCNVLYNKTTSDKTTA